MKPSRILPVALLLLLVVIFSLAIQQHFVADDAPEAAGASLGLRLPSFVSIAEAGVSYQRAGTDFLQNEAGMSAYTNVGRSINLSTLRSKYRTIEAETAEYIIGSVPIPNHDESWDVHIYAHRDGWIVAYYLKGEPVSKIIDFQSYNGGSTMNNQLSKMLGVMASAAGVKLGDVGYYDFRYPEATSMLFLAEYGNVNDQWDSFEFEIPGEYVIHERSFLISSLDSYWGDSECRLNEVTLKSLGRCPGENCWNADYGTIGAEQLPLEVSHQMSVLTKGKHTFCTLVLLYGGE